MSSACTTSSTATRAPRPPTGPWSCRRRSAAPSPCGTRSSLSSRETDAWCATTAPTVVIAGADDPAIPADHGRIVAAAVPDARLVVLEDAAHLPVVERPARVAAIVRRHLRPRDTRGGIVTDGSTPSDAARAAQGDATRRAVLGDDYVDAAMTSTTPFSAPFQDLVARYAWGDIWSRPGLARSERSIVTLAVLAALGHEHELSLHVVAARRNGLTVAQIQEILLQVAVYAGVPAANRAFRVAQRVLAADDRADPDAP